MSAGAVGAAAAVVWLVWPPVPPWRRGAGWWRAPSVAALSLVAMGLVGASFPSSRVLIPEITGYWADAGLMAIERFIHLGRTPFEWLAPWFTA